jgi:hypothetical protein
VAAQRSSARSEPGAAEECHPERQVAVAGKRQHHDGCAGQPGQAGEPHRRGGAHGVTQPLRRLNVLGGDPGRRREPLRDVRSKAGMRLGNPRAMFCPRFVALDEPERLGSSLTSAVDVTGGGHQQLRIAHQQAHGVEAAGGVGAQRQIAQPGRHRGRRSGRRATRNVARAATFTGVP